MATADEDTFVDIGGRESGLVRTALEDFRVKLPTLVSNGALVTDPEMASAAAGAALTKAALEIVNIGSNTLQLMGRGYLHQERNGWAGSLLHTKCYSNKMITIHLPFLHPVRLDAISKKAA